LRMLCRSDGEEFPKEVKEWQIVLTDNLPILLSILFSYIMLV